MTILAQAALLQTPWMTLLRVLLLREPRRRSSPRNVLGTPSFLPCDRKPARAKNRARLCPRCTAHHADAHRVLQSKDAADDSNLGAAHERDRRVRLKPSLSNNHGSATGAKKPPLGSKFGRQSAEHKRDMENTASTFIKRHPNEPFCDKEGKLWCQLQPR